jgi:hypothetical protein
MRDTGDDARTCIAPLAEEALLGWLGDSCGFTVFVAVIVIWLEFFWHW